MRFERTDMKNSSLTAVPFTRVSLSDGFWSPRQTVNREVTLPVEYKQCKETGRLDAFKLDWKPGMPHQPHRFWDSDIGKWIEAAAYSLKTHPDKNLEALVDDAVALIATAQQPDGYLNIVYTVVEPEKRWSLLVDSHELYCAGHLIEAAVAYFQATGKRQLLDIMCRNVEHIASVFGRGKGQKRGYDGHEEIELALVKLYRATGDRRHLDLAKYFIDERGVEPNYFRLENDNARKQGWEQWERTDFTYNQAHKPVCEQEEVVGHAVRAMYLYCGMADVARETGDAALLTPLRKLWKSLAHRKMYVTGGIGSTRQGEAFTFDYDLPDETAYCETCAAIGLVFWAHRMLQLTGEGDFADVMERALYNGCLSGVSLDGCRFFYANPLAVYPEAMRGANAHVAGERQEWFGCACCPPNIARLIASVGEYFYSESEAEACVHLYAAGDAELRVAGQNVQMNTTTKYPWDGAVSLRLTPERAARFTLALRIPGWCTQYSLSVNGTAVRSKPVKGYVRIVRRWQAGDTVKLVLDMPVMQVEANPRVRMDCGRVALQRGPVVYCLEQKDNGVELRDLTLPAAAGLKPVFLKDQLGGVVVLRGKALRRRPQDWAAGDLYRTAPTARRTVSITAVPYCVWGNRAPGEEMLVWLNRSL